MLAVPQQHASTRLAVACHHSRPVPRGGQGATGIGARVVLVRCLGSYWYCGWVAAGTRGRVLLVVGLGCYRVQDYGGHVLVPGSRSKGGSEQGERERGERERGKRLG
eukprot:2365193-Rhodomonas_salina.1